MEGSQTAKEVVKKILAVGSCIARVGLYYVVLAGYYLIAISIIVLFLIQEGMPFLQLLEKSVLLLNENSTLFYVLLNAVSILTYYFFYVKRAKLHSEITNKKDIQINVSVLMISFSAAAALMVNVVYCLICWNSDFEIIELSWLNFALYSIGTVILTPVTEEIIFRKVLLTELRKCIDVKKAILLSSLLFGFMHGSLFDFIYTFIFGILLAIISCKFRGIVYSIIMHSAFNLMAVLVQTIEFSSIALCWTLIGVGSVCCIYTWKKIQQAQ